MRFLPAILPLLLFGFILSACENTDDYDTEYVTEDLRDDVDAFEESLEARREEMQDRLEEAEQLIREELEAFEDNDRISKEELEELRSRMHEEAQKIQEELRNSEHDLEIAIQDLGSALEQIGSALKEDKDIEPVDYDKLRDLLPRRVANMSRYDTDGSSNSVLGIRTSKIEAKYEGDDRGMSIAVIDLGSISGVAALGMDFIDEKIDREYDEGWEKTTEIEGYPAFVEVDNKGSNHRIGSLIMVEERFMVAIEIEGRELERVILDDVVDRISFRRLRRMAD